MERGGPASTGQDGFNKHRSLVPEKDIRPYKFDGEIGKFRRWREDFTDFVDAQRPGLKMILTHISQHQSEPFDADARRRTAFGAGG